MPYAGQILDQAFAENQAAIILFTPGDISGPGGPDLLIRAGSAMALHPNRTILLELGAVPPIRELEGRQVVRITADEASRRLGKAQLIHLLHFAGCRPKVDKETLTTTDRLAELTALG